jgi:hypothetical protein
MHKTSRNDNPIAALADSVYMAEANDAASAMIVDWMEGAARTPTELEGMLRAMMKGFKSYLNRHNLRAPKVSCAFCRKTEDDVKFLVAASEVAICDECVRIAAQAIDERTSARSPSPISRGKKAALLDLLARSVKLRR